MENIITEQEYYRSKKIWNDMKFLSTQKELTDEERIILRESFEIVKKFESK